MPLSGYKSGTLQEPGRPPQAAVNAVWYGDRDHAFFFAGPLSGVLGAKGSFFEIVPFWIAVSSLLLMLLFPLTMAYVIVVHRAMDVGVVLRQGLQYALAENGVRVLQFICLLAIGLGVRWSINNYGSSFAMQIGIIVIGIALVPLIEFIAKPLRIWIDRRFFREAYNAEQILSELKRRCADDGGNKAAA